MDVAVQVLQSYVQKNFRQRVRVMLMLTGKVLKSSIKLDVDSLISGK